MGGCQSIEQIIDSSKDMAICFVIFNPAQTKRILMNYFFVRNLLLQQGFPIFTIELVYKGRKAEIDDAFHVSSDSFMFHKENLYRMLDAKIPGHFTKLAFLDADVFFQDNSWYKKASELLETHDVVEPFETANWLDLSYKQTMLSRKGVVCNQKNIWDFAYHPGFAWCMRRDWYRRVGFFEYAVSGSGDTLSSAAWLKKVFPPKFQSLPLPLVKKYNAYKEIATPRITYLKGFDIYHLYHGTRVNRQYAERHKMLHIKGDIDEYITRNEQGIFEWKDKATWNPIFLQYFKKRDDDGVCIEDLPSIVETS